MMPLPLNGVVSGDIVASTAIRPALRQHLFGAIDRFLKEQKKTWISGYETFRGDSLQCLTKSPELALRTALLIRCFIRSYEPHQPGAGKELPDSAKGYHAPQFDIRLAIGIGPVDFVRKNRISTSDGAAFRLSGEALDALKGEGSRLVVRTGNPHFDEQLEPSILLLDALIGKWTSNAAELVLYKLQNKRDEEIAGLLHISQPAVSQRKKNAGWPAVEKLVLYFEKTVQNWNQ